MMSSKRSPFAWDGVNGVDGFRLIEIPFSPLLRCDGDDGEKFSFIASRDYGRRQAYLRSYSFTRADDQQGSGGVRKVVPEKVKRSLLRLKAAAWAVVACKYRLPLRARIFKEKVVIRSSEYLNNGVHFLRSSSSCAKMPKCLMVGG